MALPPNDRFRRNLDALRSSQSDVAETIEAVVIPSTVRGAKGRDGSDTFLISTDSGASVWLGQSSMPTISTEEIFAGFQSDGGNVTMPGVLTGLEPLFVLRRMPRHAALFVVEREPLNLTLAMHVHDYVDEIRAGRLVFVLGRGDALVEKLSEFFERNPGYIWPDKMLTVPQQTPVDVAKLQELLERAGQAVARVYERAIELRRRNLSQSQFDRFSDRPRVVVLGTDPRPTSLEHAARIERALTALGMPCLVCMPDAPSRCHTVVRLEAIANHKADLVLLVNTMPGTLRSLLPDGLPVVSWFLPGAVVQESPGYDPAQSEIVFAATESVRVGFIAAGAAEESLHRCDLAADVVAFRPLSAAEVPDLSEVSVAVMMNLPDDRPEACGVNLESHLRLWSKVQDIARRGSHGREDDPAAAVFDEAQRASSVVIEEADVRDRLLSLVRTAVLPRAFARGAVEALVGCGVSVGAWGMNWGSFGTYDPRRGPMPVGDELNGIFNAVRVVVFPVLSDATAEAALDVLAAGTSVICHAGSEPFEDVYPGLAGVAKHLRFYRTSLELVEQVREMLRAEEESVDSSTSVRELIVDEHSLSRRLQQIIETVHGRQASTASVHS